MKTFLSKVLKFLRDHLFFLAHVSMTCRLGEEQSCQDSKGRTSCEEEHEVRRKD